MSDFRKKCQVCNKDFFDLMQFMEHIKKNHREITPNKIFEIGKEQKWSFRK